MFIDFSKVIESIGSIPETDTDTVKMRDIEKILTSHGYMPYSGVKKDPQYKELSMIFRAKEGEYYGAEKTFLHEKTVDKIKSVVPYKIYVVGETLGKFTVITTY